MSEPLLFVDTSESNVTVTGNLNVTDLTTLTGDTRITGDMSVTGDLNVIGNLSRTQYRPGEIIEELSSICDGSQIELTSGTYTVQNVTATQHGNTTHTAVTGSTIAVHSTTWYKESVLSFFVSMGQRRKLRYIASPNAS